MVIIILSMSEDVSLFSDPPTFNVNVHHNSCSIYLNDSWGRYQCLHTVFMLLPSATECHHPFIMVQSSLFPKISPMHVVCYGSCVLFSAVLSLLLSVAGLSHMIAHIPVPGRVSPSYRLCDATIHVIQTERSSLAQVCRGEDPCIHCPAPHKAAPADLPPTRSSFWEHFALGTPESEANFPALSDGCTGREYRHERSCGEAC